MTETRNNILHIHVHQNAYDCYSVKTFSCIWETNNRSTYFCLVTANDILSPIWSGSNWLLVSEDHQWPLNPNGNLVILSSWEAARNDQDFFLFATRSPHCCHWSSIRITKIFRMKKRQLYSPSRKDLSHYINKAQATIH